MYMQPEQLSSYCSFAAGEKSPCPLYQIHSGTRDQPYGYFGPDSPQAREMPNSGIYLTWLPSTLTSQSKVPGLICANSVCWGGLGQEIWRAFYSPHAPGQYRNISTPTSFVAASQQSTVETKNRYRDTPDPFPAVHWQGWGLGSSLCKRRLREVLSNDIFLYPAIIDDQAIRTEINVIGSQEIV